MLPRMAFSFVLLLASSALAQVQSLRDCSVTVKTPSGSGSGVIVTRNGINFVWTAAHVLETLRRTREAIDESGAKKTVVEFDDAQIMQLVQENGRTIGRLELDARVIRYSNADTGEDLALLMVRKKNFVTANAKFWLDKEPPALGTDLIHVGSLLGALGAGSVTSGIVSQHGRVLHGKIYDQVTATSFPGSSGGGVFVKSDGRYMGMLVRGAGETFGLVVPARRISEWSRKAKVEWAVREDLPLPGEEELEAMPIEDSGVRK